LTDPIKIVRNYEENASYSFLFTGAWAIGTTVTNNIPNGKTFYLERLQFYHSSLASVQSGTVNNGNVFFPWGIYNSGNAEDTRELTFEQPILFKDYIQIEIDTGNAGVGNIIRFTAHGYLKD
jgi:hypothetical protein